MVFVVNDLSLKTKNFLYFFYQRFRNVCLRREENGPTAKRKRGGGGEGFSQPNDKIPSEFSRGFSPGFWVLQKVLVCSLPMC